MQWPRGMEPEHSKVYARNEIKINADQTRIWKALCRAGLWPTWYANCGWLKFENGRGPDLELGTTFTWKTFGARVRSTVRVFEPAHALEWDAKAIGLRAYHGWQLEPAVRWRMGHHRRNAERPAADPAPMVSPADVASRASAMGGEPAPDREH